LKNLKGLLARRGEHGPESFRLDDFAERLAARIVVVGNQYRSRCVHCAKHLFTWVSSHGKSKTCTACPDRRATL
jgi:hypothetical protein